MQDSIQEMTDAVQAKKVSIQAMTDAIQ